MQVQAGVDTDGDGEIDVWTDWQEVSETYSRIEGFAKAYAVDPAMVDLSGLPDGFGIQFRFQSDDIAAVMDSILIESATVLPGDFDNDGDVDGADFLVLQRGMGDLYDASHLAEWQLNYSAAGTLEASIAVPEPSSIAIFVSLIATGCGLRQR